MKNSIKYSIIVGIIFPLCIFLNNWYTDGERFYHATDPIELIQLSITGFVLTYCVYSLKELFTDTINYEKIRVCDQCHCVGILHNDCVCSYGKYKTIELEYEVCKCCGEIKEDGNPPDTEFNKKQLKENDDTTTN